MAEYILYVPLSAGQAEDAPNWDELARRFGLKLILERPYQATVEATPEAIGNVLETHPGIQVTEPKKYHKLVSGL